MARAGLFQKGVEIAGDLDYRGVRVLGQREVDHQPGHASVMGDQTPGHVDRVQCNLLDSGDVGIAERLCVIDQRLDDQIVLDRLAVEIVGEGVDPGGPGRTPRGIGQVLDGAERLAGEHRASSRGDGDQRRIGCGVGVLQRVECGKLRIVFREHAPVVVRDADEAGAPRHDQHE